MAKLLGGTRIYGNATVDGNLTVGANASSLLGSSMTGITLQGQLQPYTVQGSDGTVTSTVLSLPSVFGIAALASTGNVVRTYISKSSGTNDLQIGAQNTSYQGNVVLNAGTGATSGIRIVTGTNANLVSTFDNAGNLTVVGNATINGGQLTVGNIVASGNVSIAGNLSITGNITSVNYETVTNTEYVTTLVATTVNAATIGNSGSTLTGTLSTAAQPNVTSVGTLTGLNVNSTSGMYFANISGAALSPYGSIQTWQFFTQNAVSGGPGSWILFPDSTYQYTAYPGTNLSGQANLALTNLSASTIGNTGAIITGSSGSFSATTTSTSTTTGALVVSGGVGIGGDLNVAGNISAASLNTVSSTQLSVTAPLVYLTSTPYPYNFDIGMYSHFIGGPANTYAHTGFVRSYSNGYWGLFSNVKTEPAGTVSWGDAGLIWDSMKVGALTIANSTASSSTTTGALIVIGGAGIAGNIVSGGSGQFGGAYNENTTSAGVFIGNTGSGTPSPRIGLFNGTTAQNWQIDNYGGTFRWFTPGVTRMQLDTNGNLAVNGLTTVSPGTQNLDSAFVITGNVWKGGVGYHDFMRVTSTYSGVTNPTKYFRLDSVGTLQIINSAYTNNIFNLTDAGALTIPSTVTVGNVITTNGVFWSNGTAYSSGGGGGSFNGGTITGALTINNTTASTSTSTGALIVNGGIGVAGNVWAGQVYATNNGNGTNFAVGDDAWIGDINVANTSRLMGQQDATQGYLVFGNSNTTNTIGRSGTNPITVTGPFNVTGNTAITNTLYAQGVYDNGNRVVSTSSGAGNLTISAGAITLTATGPGATTVGSSTAIPVITTDAYGRITALTSSSVSTTINLAGTSGTGSVAGGGTLTFASTNGVTATVSGSTITISDPQDIRSNASPTFAGGNFTGNVTRNSRAIVTNYSGNIAPTSPVMGDEWFRGNTGVMYKYLYDNVSNTYNWLNISSALYNANTAAVANTLALRDSGGNLTATNFLGTASSAKYADLAEIYASDSNYEPGTVVVFGGPAEITVTKKTHDTRVAGVISTNPAYLMNSEAVGLPVAFTGRVPCLVRGPVSKGDVLVTSAYEKYAERMTDALYRPGCILGKSLGDVAENVFATIEVVVGRF